MRQLNSKLIALWNFVLDRLGEPSTWQAIGFVAGLTTAKYQGMDWGAGAALGGTVSAAIKAIQKG